MFSKKNMCAGLASLVLLGSIGDVNSKGSPSSSSYGSRTGVYGSSMGSRWHDRTDTELHFLIFYLALRYYMYPAAGAFIYMGYGRRYNYRNHRTTPAMKAAQAKSFYNLKLNITTDPLHPGIFPVFLCYQLLCLGDEGFAGS
jgi:hypothetical protein